MIRLRTSMGLVRGGISNVVEKFSSFSGESLLSLCMREF